MWRDEAHDFNDLADRVKRIEMSTLNNHSVSIEAELPNAPSGGRDFYYQLPTGGVWHFKFNANTGVWDFVGGPPFVHEVPDSEQTSGTSYMDLTTDGPTLTVPFIGSYNFSAGANIFESGSFNYATLGLKIGSAAEEEWCVKHGAASSEYDSMSREGVRAVDAVNTICKLRYKASAGNINFRYRFLHITPVYVTA